MLLFNRYLQWQFCLREEELTLFCSSPLVCLVWIGFSEIKHNYFNVIQWALREITSRHPETVIIRRQQTVIRFLCNSIGHGTASAFSHQAGRKLRVMCAAKTTTKAPSQSLAMRRLRSGSTDEQSLVSYCVSRSVLFVLLIPLLLPPWLQPVGRKCAFC